MIPLAIGLGILGVVALRYARHYDGAYAGCGSPWHGHGSPWYGWHHGRAWYHHGRHYGRYARRGGRRWMLHAVLARLDASPAQERAILAEIDKLEEQLHAAHASLRDARGDLAATVRGSTLDEAALGGAVGRLDSAFGDLRATALESLRTIHALLDDTQRARLAELLDGRGGVWHGGPYR